MSSNQRKPFIDMAKGIGIILVIFGHAMTGENIIVSWQCTFFMPMFFICSGLCYTKPKALLENVRKTLIPYYMGGDWPLHRNELAFNKRWVGYRTNCTENI